MIVESEMVRESLLQDPQLRETLEAGRRADISLTGMGIPEPDLSGLFRAGYTDEAQLATVREMGAVGDILVDFYDINGRRLDLPVTRRVIGLSLDEMRSIPMTIGVAVGTRKAAAILGALRGKFLHVLVTDEETARAVIRLDEEHPLPG
jgi:DNA-binding transcriptional regulator LsrR (DeoR family)